MAFGDQFAQQLIKALMILETNQIIDSELLVCIRISTKELK